jgi:TonB family protein
MTDLYADLGINEAELAQMATEPEGSIFSFADFAGRPNLDFAVLYWVTAEGRVDDCRLLQPSGVQRFDQTLCGDLKSKARFKPARNAAGQPIRVPRFENVSLRTSTIIAAEPFR